MEHSVQGSNGNSDTIFEQVTELIRYSPQGTMNIYTALSGNRRTDGRTE